MPIPSTQGSLTLLSAAIVKSELFPLQDGSHGKVWGVPVWRGEDKPLKNLETRITGPLKTIWEVRDSNMATSQWVSQDWSAIKQSLRPFDQPADGYDKVAKETEQK